MKDMNKSFSASSSLCYISVLVDLTGEELISVRAAFILIVNEAESCSSLIDPQPIVPPQMLSMTQWLDDQLMIRRFQWVRDMNNVLARATVKRLCVKVGQGMTGNMRSWVIFLKNDVSEVSKIGEQRPSFISEKWKDCLDHRWQNTKCLMAASCV